MRINRIHTEAELVPDTALYLDGQIGHYLYRVLKLRQGDRLVLFNGDGWDYTAKLLSNRRDRIELQVTERSPAVPESRLRVSLVQAVGKGDRMDMALQKATELGVAGVQPLFSERTEVRLDPRRLDRRMAHWRKVMIAACEQCGRAVVPDLSEPVALGEWLAFEETGERLVLAPGSPQFLADHVLDGDQVFIVIGPEGGFSDREMHQFRLAGVTVLNLGPRVLRTETAGPAAIAVLQALYGDLRQSGA